MIFWMVEETADVSMLEFKCKNNFLAKNNNG